MKAAMSVKEAAVETGVSVDTIKKAICATDPDKFPPPLRAKRQGRAKNAALYVLADDLRAWLASWPDA